MAYKLQVNRRAEADVEEAVAWYEKQSYGLGIELLIEFLALTDSIAQHPTHYLLKHPPYRRALMKKFPYVVYFAVNEPAKEVVVLTVWHSKRDPEKLKKRLR